MDQGLVVKMLRYVMYNLIWYAFIFQESPTHSVARQEKLEHASMFTVVIYSKDYLQISYDIKTINVAIILSATA